MFSSIYKFFSRPRCIWCFWVKIVFLLFEKMYTKNFKISLWDASQSGKRGKLNEIFKLLGGNYLKDSLYLKNTSEIVSFCSKSGQSSGKEVCLILIHCCLFHYKKPVQECYQSSMCIYRALLINGNVVKDTSENI